MEEKEHTVRKKKQKKNEDITRMIILLATFLFIFWVIIGSEKILWTEPSD